MAGNVLDGDLNTRWSGNGDGARIMFDIGEVRTLSKLNVAWYKGDQRRSFYTFEYCSQPTLAQCSSSDWIAVYEGESSGDYLGLQRAYRGAVTGRFFAIQGHGNSSNSWNSITEIEVTVLAD